MRPVWPILRGLSWACYAGVALTIILGRGLGDYGMADCGGALLVAGLVLGVAAFVIQVESSR